MSYPSEMDIERALNAALAVIRARYPDIGR